MKDQEKAAMTNEDRRKARLAEALRTNLMKRKGQTYAKRGGKADQRPQGISAAGPAPDDDSL
ncbi:hypothetical protein ACFPLB_15000 [Aquamicrobium segne]|uniref:Uncharacterized protein n=1 Tax=Aquamicrobium segne TaxID=469547 RepID=A0ABW0H1I7_9HYPH